jgi:hypothetical protein
VGEIQKSIRKENAIFRPGEQKPIQRGHPASALVLTQADVSPQRREQHTYRQPADSERQPWYQNYSPKNHINGHETQPISL